MKIKVKRYWECEDDFKEEYLVSFLFARADELNLEKSIHFLKEAALRLIFSNMSGKPLTVDDIHSMIDLSEFTIELPKE